MRCTFTFEGALQKVKVKSYLAYRHYRISRWYYRKDGLLYGTFEFIDHNEKNILNDTVIISVARDFWKYEGQGFALRNKLSLSVPHGSGKWVFSDGSILQGNFVAFGGHPSGTASNGKVYFGFNSLSAKKKRRRNRKK